MTCHTCGSFMHFMRNCPHNSEVMVAQIHSSSFNDTENAAVLDSACSSTVCGERWMLLYFEGIGMEAKLSPSNRVFRFGGGETLRSLGTVRIPGVLAGQRVSINADVVKSDIPLLLSLKAMKKANIKLDIENDEAEIFGKKVPLDFTESGHYCVNINRMETKIEEVCKVQLCVQSKEGRKRTLEKLHRQFVHPSQKRLVKLLVDAGIWKKEYQGELNSMYKNC